MKNKLILFLMIFPLIFLYAYFFEMLFTRNFWWISILFVYIFFFIVYNLSLKRKELEKCLEIKNRSSIRINFWK
ncbi:MAG: hypothetical protein KKF67_01980 [Nanoarchaeota archaeon]|nr:hypothetical protein [Nanoarchaeota archaeon]